MIYGMIEINGCEKNVRGLCIILEYLKRVSQLFETHRDFGIISSYRNLSEDAKERILNKLKAHSSIDQIESSLSHLVFLYPECPLSFLISNILKFRTP
jgi:hypothetical protein